MAQPRTLMFALIGAVVAVAGLAVGEPADPAVVADLITAAGTAAEHPDAATVVVFDRTESDVEDSGLAHVVQHSLVKVLTTAGAVDLANQRFDYDPATQVIEIRTVRVHHGDGTWQDVDPAAAIDVTQPAHAIYWGARMRVLQLPRLAVGDAVEVEVRRKGFMIAYLDAATGEADDDRYVPPMRGHWYDVQVFQAGVPILEKTVTVRTPRTKPLQYRVYNGEVFSETSFTDDQFVYRFWKTDCPPAGHEWRAVNLQNTAPKVVMTTVAGWPAKSRWFWGANTHQFDATPAIDALVAELTRGLKTDDAKVAALNHWAAQNIRYCGLNMGEGEGYTLHPGEMILRERSGVCKDIAGMAITLCRAAGYEVYPAMTMAGARVEAVPADQFNHCVGAWKKSDGTWEMLDPTWIPFSRYNWSRLEGEQQYVIGSPAGEELATVRPFTADENATRLRVRGTIDDAGTLRAHLELRPDGAADTRLRRAIGETPLASVEANLRAWIATLAPGARLAGWQASDPVDFAHPMTLDADVEVPGFAVVGQQTVTWRSPVCNLALTDYAGVVRIASARGQLEDETRTTPIMLWMAQTLDLDEEIRLPGGFRAAAPGDSDAWHAGDADSFARCDLRVTPDGKTMRVAGTVTYARREVPTRDYPALRATVQAFTHAAETVLVARRKGA